MITFLNNKPIEIVQDISISELLFNQNIAAERGVAIAVNNVVIQKKSWEEFKIKENDKVTIIKATQGG